jgi:hypothetical protein
VPAPGGATSIGATGDELPRLAGYIGYRVSWSDGRIGRVTGFAADTAGNGALLVSVGIAGRRTVLCGDDDIEAVIPAQRLLLCRAPGE